jgi:hypothetical protein
MNDQNSLKSPENRSILDHILYPTPTDIIAVRIIFWISIIIGLVLPRYYVALENNPTWKAISVILIALAIGVRIVVYVRSNKTK